MCMAMKRISFVLMLLTMAWTVKSQAQKPGMVVGAYVTSWTDEYLTTCQAQCVVPGTVYSPLFFRSQQLHHFCRCYYNW